MRARVFQAVVRLQAVVWVVASLAAPRIAHACAVCASGRTDETRVAFIVTTAFMTLLPLAMLGGAFLWLRRRLRELDEKEAALVARRSPPRRVSAEA